MSIERKVWPFVLAAAILLVGRAPAPLANVISIEDEDSVVPTPTPRSKPTKVPTPPPSAKPEAQAPSKPEGTAPASLKGDRGAKMSATLGFHYFVKSGFLVKDPGGVPSVGTVRNFKGQISFSTPKRCRLEPSEGSAFQVGDRFMVFHVGKAVQEEESGYSGFWVQNLAVVKVIESDEEGTFGEVVKTYAPFKDGDLLKPFNEEMDRWNQASTRKELPSQEIHCRVAGGEGVLKDLVQPGFVILTAGAEQGVVEGMVLEVRQPVAALDGAGKTTPCGKVRVFYAGEDHSLAQILNSPDPIRKGFEAIFRP
jgi:hypothetical protein